MLSTPGYAMHMPSARQRLVQHGNFAGSIGLIGLNGITRNRGSSQRYRDGKSGNQRFHEIPEQKESTNYRMEGGLDSLYLDNRNAARSQPQPQIPLSRGRGLW